MKFYLSSALLLAGASVSHALAVPANTTLSARAPKCTTDEKFTSSCTKFLGSDFSLKYSVGCGFMGSFAYHAACSPNKRCCIYTKTNRLSVADVRRRGRGILDSCRTADVDLCFAGGGLAGCKSCFMNSVLWSDDGH